MFKTTVTKTTIDKLKSGSLNSVAALLLGAYASPYVSAQKSSSFDWEEQHFAHSFDPQPIGDHRPGGPFPLPLGSSSKQALQIKSLHNTVAASSF